MTERRFAIIGHRVPSSGKIILNDLAGGSGRLDVLCRAINSALFISHGIRDDTHITLHLLGSEFPPRRVWICGAELRSMRVEERAIGGMIGKVLAEPIPPLGQWPSISPGIRHSSGGLAETIVDWQREGVELYTLDADAPRLWDSSSVIENQPQDYGKVGFFLSDDLPLDAEEERILAANSLSRSLGDTWLQGHSAITIVHQLLDLGTALRK